MSVRCAALCQGGAETDKVKVEGSAPLWGQVEMSGRERGWGWGWGGWRMEDGG